MSIYIETLARFSSGDATIAELDDAIAEKLTELRMTQDITDEQRLLSTVELMIEETRDGFREPLDIYIAVIQLLDSFMIVPSVRPETTFEEVSPPAASRPTTMATDSGELRELVGAA